MGNQEGEQAICAHTKQRGVHPSWKWRPCKDASKGSSALFCRKFQDTQRVLQVAGLMHVLRREQLSLTEQLLIMRLAPILHMLPQILPKSPFASWVNRFYKCVLSSYLEELPRVL